MKNKNFYYLQNTEDETFEQIARGGLCSKSCCFLFLNLTDLLHQSGDNVPLTNVVTDAVVDPMEGFSKFPCMGTIANKCLINENSNRICGTCESGNWFIFL